MVDIRKLEQSFVVLERLREHFNYVNTRTRFRRYELKDPDQVSIPNIKRYLLEMRQVLSQIEKDANLYSELRNPKEVPTMRYDENTERLDRGEV